MLQKIRNIKGFTLVELVIAAAIIGILILFSARIYIYERNNSKLKNDKQIEETIDLDKDKDLGGKL